MVRSPCCWKVGLKKGPWTPEEDEILINYIQKYGHDNWRALPRYAGLLRCGKSCRLRWTNYLRPDIKRGNFTKEEEDTIIELHAKMGNRWSAIAAKLSGRTDNEIKNVWHTHLKKRVHGQNKAKKAQDEPTSNTILNPDNIVPNQTTQPCIEGPQNIDANTTTPPPQGFEAPAYAPVSSPQPSYSEILSAIMDTATSHSEMSDNISIINSGIVDEQIGKGLDYLPEFEGSFWWDPPFDYDSNSTLDFSYFNTELIDQSNASSAESILGNDNLDLWNTSESTDFSDGLDFWCDLFVKACDSKYSHENILN